MLSVWRVTFSTVDREFTPPAGHLLGRVRLHEVLDFGPAVVSLHLGDPDGMVERAHAVGALWMQVMNVEQTRRAVDLGADVIIAQGGEAGGHGGGVSTMVLVPQGPRHRLLNPGRRENLFRRNNLVPTGVAPVKADS